MRIMQQAITAAVASPGAPLLPAMRGAWEARTAAVESGDADHMLDLSGNGRTMSYEGARPKMVTVDGHASMRLETGARMLNSGFNDGSYTGKRTYYFVGKLDPSTTYRAIFGGGGNWFGTRQAPDGQFQAYSVSQPLDQAPPVGIFYLSLEVEASALTTLRTKGGVSSKAQSGTVFQSSGDLRLGSSNGYYYPMQGEFIAGYVADAAHDQAVIDYITHHWPEAS